jgi:rRNA processing protein Krr1/Pno1
VEAKPAPAAPVKVEAKTATKPAETKTAPKVAEPVQAAASAKAASPAKAAKAAAPAPVPAPVVTEAPVEEKKKRIRKKKGAAKEGAAAEEEEEAEEPVVGKTVPKSPEKAAPKAEVVVEAAWIEINRRSKNVEKVEPVVISAVAPTADAPAVVAPVQVSHTIDVGKNVPVIFGAKGVTIMKIQADTGCKLDIPKGSSICTITGDAAAVKRGLDAINDILNANEYEEITVNAKDVGAIVGKLGANIKQIQAQSGARITMVKDSNKCLISGDATQRNAAKALLEEYALHGGPKPEHIATMELTKQHKFLVLGNKGETIQRLQQQTGCRLDFKDFNLIISGTLVAVETAKGLVNKVIKDNSHEHVVSFTNDPSVIRAVRGGLQQIQTDTGARCDLVDNAYIGKDVKVVGTVEAIKSAEKKILALVEAELGPPVAPKGEVVVAIPLGNATGGVLGRGGTNKTKIQEEHGVTISIKSRDNMCYIVGKADKVEGAKKVVDEIVEKQKKFDEKDAARKAAAAAELEAAAAAIGDGSDPVSAPAGWEGVKPLPASSWGGIATAGEAW